MGASSWFNVQSERGWRGLLFSKSCWCGVVIRENEGNFIVGLSKKLHVPLGAVETEAKAFEAGIVFAGEIGIWNSVLEGDLIVMVQALCEFALAPSLVASLVYRIVVAVYDFRSVNFSHVCCNGNKPAYFFS